MVFTEAFVEVISLKFFALKISFTWMYSVPLSVVFVLAAAERELTTAFRNE